LPLQTSFSAAYEQVTQFASHWHARCLKDYEFENAIKTMNTTTCEHGSTESQRPYSARRQQHHVTFFCDAPGAETVTLTGDFNGWDPAANPMYRTPDGRWMASLELHHGHHTYLFLVDGKPTLDPNASGITRNARNERVSLIAVS